MLSRTPNAFMFLSNDSTRMDPHVPSANTICCTFQPLTNRLETCQQTLVLLLSTCCCPFHVVASRILRSIGCGGCHTVVATEEGVVWAFGKGEYGQLGLNNEDDRLLPTRVDPQRFAGAKVDTVAGGFCHSATVTEGGALFTWGKGQSESDDAGSQVPCSLGHADLRNSLVPTIVSPLLFLGDRVGRWHGLTEELQLAFAMGTHARLGDGIGVAGGKNMGCVYLMMTTDLVERVVEACRWGRGGEEEKLGEGVLRLMGARRTRGQRERVLFIGTQFSILYTSMYSPAEAATPRA
jgi:hypothetical protein